MLMNSEYRSKQWLRWSTWTVIVWNHANTCFSFPSMFQSIIPLQFYGHIKIYWNDKTAWYDQLISSFAAIQLPFRDNNQWYWIIALPYIQIPCIKIPTFCPFVSIPTTIHLWLAPSWTKTSAVMKRVRRRRRRRRRGSRRRKARKRREQSIAGRSAAMRSTLNSPCWPTAVCWTTWTTTEPTPWTARTKHSDLAATPPLTWPRDTQCCPFVGQDWRRARVEVVFHQVWQ